MTDKEKIAQCAEYGIAKILEFQSKDMFPVLMVFVSPHDGFEKGHVIVQPGMNAQVMAELILNSMKGPANA